MTVRRICVRCGETKALTSYRRIRPGRYTEICRTCEKAGAVNPKPIGGRMCIVCAIEYPRARFVRRPDGRYAEVCLACTSDPAVRVTLEQEQAAAIVVGALRRIASGRFDGQSGPPDMGVEGMRSQARIALTAIEEAR